jgi:hypothetical protein
MGLIAQTLDRYAQSQAVTFKHDRKQTVGASEIGQCARKVFWLKNEDDPEYAVPRDPEYTETWGARMRGTVFENHFWVPALKKRFGSRLHHAGKNQRTFHKGFLTATPDGMVWPLEHAEQQELGVDASCILVECKTADPRTNLTEAKAENVYQAQVQMGLIRDTTTARPTHAIISYADASFWSDIKEFTVAFDPAVYQAAQDRARLVMTAKSVTETQPEGWIAGGKECNYCPFTKPCGVERRNLPFQSEPVDLQFVAEMTDMAREYRRLENNSDFAGAALRLQAESIKARLREKGVTKIPGVLTWSPVKGRNGYDSKAIKQAAIDAGINVEQFATQAEASDRLVIQVGADLT